MGTLVPLDHPPARMMTMVGSAVVVTNNAPQCCQQSPSMSSTTNLYTINNEALRHQQRTSALSFSAKAENPVRISALLGHSRATGSPACAGDDDGGSAAIVANDVPQCRQ